MRLPFFFGSEPMPLSADEAAALVDAAAAAPAEVVVEGNSVVAHKLSDLLELENRRSAQAAAGKGHFGLRFTRLVPPGCG